MNHGARGVLGARGETVGGLAAGDLTGRVIGLAIKVHKTVGPGLLEQIYEDCLCHEKTLHGLTGQRQVKLPLIYNGVRLPHACRTDIVAGETVVLEIKSIERILPVHEAQLLTYLRLSSCAVGLLLNFNASLLKDGLRRFVKTASCVFSSCHNRDHREAGSAARPRDALGKPNLFSNQFVAEHGPDRCLSQPGQLPGVTSPNKQERESQLWHNQSGLA